jgi:hypothetical protein
MLVLEIIVTSIFLGIGIWRVNAYYQKHFKQGD